tara:strand:+ start:5740 stop:7188 length:1449 start_codon:yes stop_codon:yes gene_type:complete
MKRVNVILKSKRILEKELKSIRSSIVKQRISNDSYSYIRLISTQILSNEIIKGIKNMGIKQSGRIEIKRYLEKDNFRRCSSKIDRTISIKGLLKIFFIQLYCIFKWFRNKRRTSKLNLLIFLSFDKDLIKHIEKKPLYKGLDILIPSQLLIILGNIIYKNKLQANSDKFTSGEYKNLNKRLSKLYQLKRNSYVAQERSAEIIINFISSFNSSKCINQILCYASHQGYLENYIAINKQINKSKRWKGVFIALHGGNYGISYGYPIMWYHCKKSHEKDNLNLLMPSEFHQHYKKDLNFFEIKKNFTKSSLAIKKQYGFSILHEQKDKNTSSPKNNELYIFGPNLTPQRDSGLINQHEFSISNSIMRWLNLSKIWTHGDIKIILRPECKAYISNYFSKYIKDLCIINLRNKKEITNQTLIFEGPSSALRNHILAAKQSIIFIPKKIFNISKDNYINSQLNKRFINLKIVDREDKLYKRIAMMKGF